MAKKKVAVRHKLLKAFKSCAIVRALSYFSSLVYRAFSRSIFAKVFTSYDSFSAWAGKSFFGGAINSVGSSGTERTRRIKHRVAEDVEQSVIISAVKKISSSLLVLSLSSLGVLFFSFGIFTAVIFLLKKYTFDVSSPDMADIIAGTISILISLVLLTSKKSFAQGIYESKAMNFLLFGVFNMNAGKVREAEELPVYNGIGVTFMLGMALGLATIFVSPIYVVVAAAAVIISIQILASPESGVIIGCLMIPFAPTLVMVGIVLLTATSLFAKALCGKRVIRISLIDIPVFGFLLLTVAGGLVSKSTESIRKMLVMACFILAFFLVENIIRSVPLFNKCAGCIAFSGAIVSLIGIMENYIGSPSTIWQDAATVGQIKGRVVATLENPNVLGEYLLIVTIITAAYAFTVDSSRKRFALACAAAFDAFCLVLTWSRGAWLGFIFGIVLFMLIESRHFFTGALLCVPLGAVVVAWGGNSVFSRFASSFSPFSDTSSAYRLNIWRGVLKMLGDVFPFGIGIGEQAFASVYPIYSLNGIETAPHSHNLYLQITAELGIGGTLVFLAAVFMILQYAFSYVASANVKRNRTIVIALACAMIAFLMAGFTDYVWYNYRIMLFFWLVAGLSVTSVNLSKTMIGESGDMFY